MSNADDRCAHMLASGPCGVWRDTHPQIPFKPEFMHAFVEPAPQPAPSGEYAFCKFIDGKMVECDGYGNEPGWRERSQHGESVPIPPGSTFRLTEAQYAQLIANHQPAPSGDEAKQVEACTCGFGSRVCAKHPRCAYVLPGGEICGLRPKQHNDKTFAHGCGHLFVLQATQPAPSGDEAKVIADLLDAHDVILSARNSLSAGTPFSIIREIDRGLAMLADAIARRGSEGK